MSNVKKYVLTAVTLGLIAMASGLLIGATNLITAEKIEKNNQLKIEEGINDVFHIDKKHDAAVIFDRGDVDGYNYIKHVYEVTCVAPGAYKDGYAFLAEGSNMYGKLSVIIGINGYFELSGVSIVTNEQTYASTLVENYINPLNEGSHDYLDVKCGATYGATLIKDMIEEAKLANQAMHTK